MKKIILVCALLAVFAKPAFSQLSFGQPEKINSGWQFSLNDKPSQTVDLPHDWSVREPLSPTLASATGYLPGGIGWYRKTLTIPTDKQGEKVYLYFEGVYNRSEVFVNGQSVGSRPNGYISFAFDITSYIQYGKENQIALRVDHSQSADSRWYTGSGIYRDVWLIYANPVHIAQWGVFAYPSVEKNQGILNVEIEVDNGTDDKQNLVIQNELVSPQGKIVATNSQKLHLPAKALDNKISFQLKVKNPQLWNLENPTLYTLKTCILQNGKVIDKTETATGFRSFTFDPNKGFVLNGENRKMKGVCIHHDAGVLGAAVPKDVWKRRLLTLKEIGVNAIRTSHNPQAPDLYDLCDELGLLVLNEAYDEWEFPKNKWIAGWNVGTPGHQGSFDIFEKYGEQDLADMVRRDRNHVSVFVWSIGNEVDYPNDPYSHPILDGNNSDFTQALKGGYKKEAPDANRLGDIAKRLVAVVKQYDKFRPTTAGLAGVAMSNETEYPGALDITGYNYTESRYLSDHEKYPNRVIFGSETRHDLAAWKAVTDNEHIFGQFIWTGIDYLGESGKWPARGFNSGMVDFGGFIKPRGYFRQSLWSDKPMIYIGTTNVLPIWNFEDGQTVRVTCYTNAAKAKLELNGKLIGNAQDYNEQTGIISWDIPYQTGKLEAIGLDKDNKEIARYAILSSKQPYALRIETAENVITKDKGVAQIVVQVVDENGVPVMFADNEVTCQIAGSAKLLGLEAGNNADMGDYTNNKQRVYLGRLLAYIQATGEAEEIKVTFSSPWLKSAEVTINSKTVQLMVKNPSDFDRLTDLVEIPLADIQSQIPLKEGQVYEVKNRQQTVIPSQVTSDAKLLFQVGLKANETAIFSISAGSSRTFEPKVNGWLVKERFDDFAWENDRVAYRIYGQALIKKDGPSNGIDIWYKHTPELIMYQLYEDERKGVASYHNDNGKGLDDYDVKCSLGAGAMAPYVGDSLWLNENFVSSEVLDNGPLRTTFKLIYKDIMVGGKVYTESRTFSIDAGAQLTKVTQEYGFTKPTTVAAGIVLRSADDVLITDKYYIEKIEPKTKKVDGIYIGMVFPQGIEKVLKSKGHALAISTYQPNHPMIYYTGYGWSQYGFTGSADFQRYLANFVKGLKQPLIVKKISRQTN
jgi:beta-galactosidase/beta-glucuronidase